MGKDDIAVPVRLIAVTAKWRDVLTYMLLDCL